MCVCVCVHVHKVYFLLGLSEEELMAQLKTLKSNDADAYSGKLFGYSYHTEGDKLDVVKKFFDKFEDRLPVAPSENYKEDVVQAFFTAFMRENAISPVVFPSQWYVTFFLI